MTNSVDIFQMTNRIVTKKHPERREHAYGPDEIVVAIMEAA